MTTTESRAELTQEEFESMIRAAAEHDIANVRLAFSDAYTGEIVPYPYTIPTPRVVATGTPGLQAAIVTGATSSSGGTSMEAASKHLKALMDTLPRDQRSLFDNPIKEQKEKFDNLGKDTLGHTEKRIAGIQKQPGGMSKEEFERRVKADAKRDIDDYITRRNAIADKIIEVGNRHPEQYELLTMLSRGISAFFTEIWNKIASFFVELFQKIVQWVTEAWNKVKAFFEGVANWIKNLF